jgi:hypothetical protein
MRTRPGWRLTPLLRRRSACYDRFVRRRVSPAVVGIVLALVALRPVLLDRCVLACAGDAAASTPSCHHTSQEQGARVDAPAHACGHDHGAIVLGANAAASHDPTLTMVWEAFAVSADTVAPARSHSSFQFRAPPSTASLHSVSGPLRV